MPDTDDEGVAPSALDLASDPRLATVVLIAVVGTFGSDIASPTLPAIADTFDVSSTRIGLVMAAFTVPTIVSVPLTGVLADVHGRRRIILPSLVLFGLAGAAIGMAPTFEVILLLRALQGVAYAGVMPLTVTVIGDLYTGAEGSTAQGLRVSVNGISSMVVPAITGLLVAVAWNYPFALYALAFPAAAVAYLVLPETGRTDDGSGTEAGTGTGPGIVATLRSYARSIWTEVDDRASRTLLFGGFVRDFVRLTVMTFVPLFAVQALGASAFEAGVAVGMRGVPRIVVSPLAGAVVGRFSQRTALVAAFGTATAGGVSIAFAPSVPLLWGAVVLYGAGDSLLAPVLKNAVTELTVSEYRAGVINGMQVLKSAAQSIAPVLFGFVLAAFGFEAVFLGAGAVGACYVVVLVLIVR